jgi:hypothetical protein
MPPFLLGSGQGEVFPALVGIGILLVIPEIMKEAKKKLGVTEGIMGSLAGAAWKQIKPVAKFAEVTSPYAIGAAGSAGGGIRSAAHLLASEQSPLRQAGGIKGLINADPDQRINTLESMRDVLTKGYENKKGKMVGGTKTAGQKWQKRGKTARVWLDRTVEGRLGDAESVESLLAKKYEREEEKEKEAQELKQQAQIGKNEKESIDQAVSDV